MTNNQTILNWKMIKEKWPSYQIGKNDEQLLDLSRCEFIGEGNHEIVVYTFDRYLELAETTSKSGYPVCLRFGIHYPEYVSDEEPAIGHMRSSLYHNTTGLVEPAAILAIIACDNGRVFWERLGEELIKTEPILGDSLFPNEIWLRSNSKTVLDCAKTVLRRPLPQFITETPSGSASVELSLGSDWTPQFNSYFPSELELIEREDHNWIYKIKKKLKNGESSIRAPRERVVLTEDLRRLDDSLYKGQLGWTIVEPGYTLKNNNVSISVEFDSGVRTRISVFWVEFVRDECADEVAAKIVENYRNSPFDADPEVAEKWVRDLPFYHHELLSTVGKGLEEIYAYSFKSCAIDCNGEFKQQYPLKIGYTASIDGALGRINGQFPRALADDAMVLFIGRCHDGRKTEMKIHKKIKEDGRKIESAPGSEWFLSTRKEVARLFLENSECS